MLFADPSEQPRCRKFSFESDFVHEPLLASFRKPSPFQLWNSDLNASVHLLRKVLPSVVHLRTEISPEHRSAAILGTERAGSGVVLSSVGGLILTAHYLLIGADRVQIDCLDGRTVEGRVFGVDYDSGLGIVAPEQSGLAGLPLAPQGHGPVGSEAFLVASIGDEHRVASGLIMSVSGFDALWEFCLAAAIYFSAPNPGLGGGPLLDAHGRVLGIAALSMADVARPTVVFPGTACAAMIEAIETHGVYRPGVSGGWLGLMCLALGPRLVVSGVFPGSPADQSGLQPGDTILSYQGREVSDRGDFYRRIRQTGAGATATIRVRRSTGTVELELRTGALETYFA